MGIYDRMAFSFMNTDRKQANDLFRFAKKVFDPSISFNLENKYAIQQLIMQDMISCHDIFETMKNKETSPKFERAVASHNLAVSKFFRYHDVLKLSLATKQEVPKKYQFHES